MVVLGVEHLICAGEAGLLERFKMQLAYGDKPLEHIGRAVRVGLMKHSLVAVAGSPRLVGVNSGDDEDLVLDLLLHLTQA